MLFADEFLENISLLESQLKDEYSQYENQIEVITDEIDIATVNMNMALLELNNINSVSQYNTVRSTANEMKSLLNELKSEKPKKSVYMQQLKIKITQEKNKQKGNIAGLDNQFLLIIEKYGIKRQTFFAGAMN